MQGIERRHGNELWAVSDARKGGAPDGVGYTDVTKNLQTWLRRLFKPSRERQLLEEEIEKGRRLNPK